MKDVLHGHEKEHHHMKSALENQKKLSPRPSPRSREGKAFDPTGATTRNVQVPPLIYKYRVIFNQNVLYTIVSTVIPKEQGGQGHRPHWGPTAMCRYPPSIYHICSACWPESQESIINTSFAKSIHV